MAAVLIAIGVALVKSRALVDRFGNLSPRWNTTLPLVSAGVVTVLGVGIILHALSGRPLPGL